MTGWQGVAVMLGAGGIATVISGFVVPVGVRRRLEPFTPARQQGTVTQLSLSRMGVWLTGLFRYGLTFGGERTDLAVRIERAGVGVSARQFRSVQLIAAFFGLLLASLVAVVWALPAVVVLGVLVGFPCGALWVCDQVLVVAYRRRSAQVLRELPVVVEQLAGLMKNGVGLAEACADVAAHTAGLVAADLARIAREIGHGVPVEVALQAWADRHDVPAVRRVVAVLDAHRHAADLGGLLAAEVRELRAQGHRELLALMQQREQQVWIPVTVATLVPGVLLLGVPFVYTLGVVLG